MLHSIGIDVHQEQLVVASSTGRVWRFSRDDQGLAALTRMVRAHPCAVVAMEPSGGFERRVMRACWEQAIPVTLVNAWRVRAWITGEGIRTKTDTIDAKMLARFAADKQLVPMQQPEKTRLQLQELVRARRRLTDQAVSIEQQISALLGVAPITRQSGKGPGTAHIWGGRARVRAALWMPTLVARRWNPVIRAFAERLKAEGKPGKLITIACMHKLVVIINAMLRDHSTWDPSRAPA